MEIKDKRLLDRMDLQHQKKYNEKISKLVPNAADKFEDLEIIHEPINLLEKIKSRKKRGGESNCIIRTEQ